jgi:hypothetical protein
MASLPAKIQTWRLPISRKRLFTIICIGTPCLGFGILLEAMTPTSAAADCGSNPPPDSTCLPCHPDDYLAKEDFFAAELDFTPVSIATQTTVPSGKLLTAPLVIAPSPESTTSSNLPHPLILGGSAALMLIIL